MVTQRRVTRGKTSCPRERWGHVGEECRAADRSITRRTGGQEKAGRNHSAAAGGGRSRLGALS